MKILTKMCAMHWLITFEKMHHSVDFFEMCQIIHAGIQGIPDLTTASCPLSLQSIR